MQFVIVIIVHNNNDYYYLHNDWRLCECVVYCVVYVFG